MSAPSLWVVKLGGSLWAADALLAWLEVLGRRPVIVVPGGGLFADAVREAQQRWGFDDQLAHTLAVSAMTQYGLMLQGLCPTLLTATEPESLKAALKNGRSAIWLPDAQSLPVEQIRASWDVTSDSLAVWLAKVLDARHLLLIKSVRPPAGEAAIGDLSRMGLLDRACPEMTQNCAARIWLTGPDQHRILLDGLEGPEGFFTRAVSL